MKTITLNYNIIITLNGRIFKRFMEKGAIRKGGI